MRTSSFLLLASLAIPSLAAAEPVTVWLQPTPPEVRAVEKADKETGGTLHLWATDLAFPPEPETAADQSAYDGLTAAAERGETRWDEFEVELSIAEDIGKALDQVSLMRTRRDREELVRALLLQGAAVARAASATDFATSPALAPYRRKLGDSVVPAAWADAVALLPETVQRGDLFDGTAWIDWQRFTLALTSATPGKLTVGPDDGGEVWVDGAIAPPGTMPLRPGKHWIHVVRNGVVSARSVLLVEPGVEYTVPRRVSQADIDAAVAAVAAGKRSDVPASVTDSLALLVKQHGGDQPFLAAADGNQVSVLPLDARVALNDDKLVTLLVTADIGGGIRATSGFAQNEGSDMQFAPAASGGLGVELGVSYFALGVGLDGVITPGRTVAFSADANPAPDQPNANQVSALPLPWLGIGAYALRPTTPDVTVAILANVGYVMPANLGFGGRIAVGIPIDEGKNWVRVLVGGSYAPVSFRDGPPVLDAYLRVGFAGRVDQ